MLLPILVQKSVSPSRSATSIQKMEKTRKLTTRQYVGLVRDLNSRIEHMTPLFDENQQLEKSELVDYLANKAPSSHTAMLISQGFNPEKGVLATFI